jgi:hypothetical protein
MLQFLTNNPETIDSLLKLTLLLAGIFFFWWSGRTKNAKLQSALDVARQDIKFLLEVERLNGEELRLYTDSSNKNKIRQLVRETTELNWSGKNIASAIRRKQATTEKSSVIGAAQEISKVITGTN